ncbi:succinyl-diaminopimelate desuccinylase [Desulfobaculum xiamenense]|uniref:Succinyl-diaminopimelate desuccinylase n=1 Tax=Desulfobaculum xiamenense TaxID=995050 RepID=A0A846QRA0_9BACT|nr:M20/M25/M40 family metallo-hydrolase [Desulfobaculum xiamenense]NJB69510.1 succinyl-diaminopimelate desuccinylase [Desulfobaculum xiamenense]
MIISDDAKKVMDLTCELVRFRSTASRPDEVHACADFIAERIAALGVTPERFEFDGVPSVAALPKHGHAPVLLMAHFDVVEAESDEQFAPYIDNERLYGRGCVDDKYGVALALVLFEKHLNALRAAGGSLENLPFGILFTCDEEQGGHLGAAKVLERISTDFCIALDGGTPDSIITKGKGVLDLRLIAQGRPAHGARPWLGENAFDTFIEDYAALKALFPPTTDDQWQRTMNMGIVRVGGATPNKVPGKAEGVLDIRYTENDDVDALLTSMKARVKGSIEVMAREPLFFAGESPYLDLLLETVPEAATAHMHGASDARFLSANGIPAVVWGADSEMSQHGPEEHVTLASLDAITARLDTYLAALARHARQ